MTQYPNYLCRDTAFQGQISSSEISLEIVDEKRPRYPEMADSLNVKREEDLVLVGILRSCSRY